MLHTFWVTVFYRPLYNLLLVAVSISPAENVGIAIVLLTLAVKLVLFPLTQKAIESQMQMGTINDEVNAIREKVTDKTEQNKQIFALYKERKINPLSGCLPMLIQLPIIWALYLVFIHGLGSAPVPPYSFIHGAGTLSNLNFLGVNLAGKSLVFALIAGFLQFLQAKFAQRRQVKPTGTGMQAEFAKSMQTQMVYIFPLLIVFIAWKISAAVALYWIVSNIVTVGQEIYTAKKHNIPLMSLYIKFPSKK